MSPVSSALRPRSGDAQHARHRVRLELARVVAGAPGGARRSRRRPSSSAARPRSAAPRAARRASGWPASSELAIAATWSAGEHGARAADVVAVAVAEHQQVDALVAARAQQGHEDALAGIALARILRPGVEEQHVRRVRTSTAVPCPTSAATRSKLARRRQLARRRRAGQRERHGQQPGAPGQRQHDQQRAPSRPAAWAQTGAAGTIQTAPGIAARAASRSCSRATTRRASGHSSGTAMPSSASGVTSSVTTGIATRLAMKPTSDTCWKKTSSAASGRGWRPPGVRSGTAQPRAGAARPARASR